MVAMVVGGTAGGALAEAPASSRGVTLDVPDNPLETPWSRPQATYVMQDPGLPVLVGDAVHVVPNFSNVIFLNNCKPNGCTVNAGGNNSTAPTPSSSIPNRQSLVEPFAYSDEVWNRVVDCVREAYAPFAVKVVDVRPTSGNYHMGIVAGRPQNIGMSQGVGGVSPYTCGYIPNAVSFSFSNIYGPNVDDICWTAAQETAHSWGLDHKFDNRDPMTYLSSGPSRKLFQNEDGACGEYSARSCQCGGSTMNSFQEILATFGSATPTPPMVSITAPVSGAVVQAGFPIRANIVDDIAVSRATLHINGQQVGNPVSAPPFVWNAPPTLGQGRHTITVTGYDIADTPASASVEITLGKACGRPSDCDKSTDTCVDGRCVAGTGVAGGLGQPCAANTECASGSCVSDAAGTSHCVEWCKPSLDGCPSNFQCVETGDDSGVCWPGDDEGTCNSGTGMPGFLVLGFVALLVVRRRR